MSATHDDPEYVRNRATLRRLAHSADTPCARCGHPIDWHATRGQPWSFTAGHITPVIHGGSHNLENLQPEHWRCNTSAGATLGNRLRRQTPPTTRSTPQPAHSREW